MKRRGMGLISIAAFGYAFLYLPILSVVFYSFNDSRLVTLWGGFSLRWYRSLLQDEEILASALLSLKIAAVSATLATVFGTLIALSLTRLGRFKGRTLLTGMVTAPLVMPEVITGVSLLFLFISLGDWLGWPATAWRRHHHHRPHHLFTGLRHLVVRSRLAGMDQSLEEAAMDLGAGPCGYFSISPCRPYGRACWPAGCWRSPCRWMTW